MVTEWNPPFFRARDLLDLRIGQHRGLEMKEFRVFRRFFEPVAMGAREHLDRHDQLLADRVDRRIGDLGKELFEIGVQQAGLLREHGERRILAH